MGLWYTKDTGMSLTAYSDADHAGCQDTRRSTSGRAQFLGDKLVSWFSKKQKTTPISSTEAEYIALYGCFKSKAHRCTLPFYKGASGKWNSGTILCPNRISIGRHLHQTFAMRKIQLLDRKARNEKHVPGNSKMSGRGRRRVMAVTRGISSVSYVYKKI
ncbi:hypothetical protein Tco_0897005 [Tanacetum coccineum]